MEKRYVRLEREKESEIDVNRTRRAVEPDMHMVPCCRQCPRGTEVMDNWFRKSFIRFAPNTSGISSRMEQRVPLAAPKY